MIVYVLAEYGTATEHYNKGDVIEVSEEKYNQLVADSPGSFSLEKPVEEKAPDTPAKDKAVKRSTTRRKAPAKKDPE